MYFLTNTVDEGLIYLVLRSSCGYLLFTGDRYLLASGHICTMIYIFERSRANGWFSKPLFAYFLNVSLDFGG